MVNLEKQTIQKKFEELVKRLLSSECGTQILEAMSHEKKLPKSQDPPPKDGLPVTRVSMSS